MGLGCWGVGIWGIKVLGAWVPRVWGARGPGGWNMGCHGSRVLRCQGVWGARGQGGWNMECQGLEGWGTKGVRCQGSRGLEYGVPRVWAVGMPRSLGCRGSGQQGVGYRRPGGGVTARVPADPRTQQVQHRGHRRVHGAGPPLHHGGEEPPHPHLQHPRPQRLHSQGGERGQGQGRGWWGQGDTARHLHSAPVPPQGRKQGQTFGIRYSEAVIPMMDSHL